MRPALSVVLVLPLLMAPSAVTAQRIAGTVLDRETTEAVASALIQLVARDSTVLASAFSDERGRFTLAFAGSIPAGGSLYVARIGYRAMRAALEDLPADLADLSIALERDPVQLEEITVPVARNRDLLNAGFYNRQRLGFGRFITRDMLEDRYRTSRTLGDVMQQVTGVIRVQEDFNQLSVFFLRSMQGMGPPCPALFYLDGVYQGRELQRISIDDIEAIEVYRGPSEIPAQYGGAEAACGVVLLWSRTGAGGAA